MSRRRLPLVNLARFADLGARRDRIAQREREMAGATTPRWYRISNATDTEAKIYIYDEIGYWGVTASDFVVDLEAITKPRIAVHINSPGGECYDGLAIYNALVRHSAEIAVQVDGLAASAASFVAMAGDTIEVCKTAEMMIHDASGLCWGNAGEMRRMVEQLDRMSDNIAGIYAERAGGEATDWRAVMQEERWYSAREAVAAKLADKVVGDVAPEDKPEPAEPEDSGTRKIFDLSVFRYAGRSAQPEQPREEGQRVRWRPHADFDPLQPRGDDGKWVDGLPEGIGGKSWLTLDAWNDLYAINDESALDSGLVVISMLDGSTQIAYDHPGDDEHRFVLIDNGPAELRGLADTVQRALIYDDPDTPGENVESYETPEGEHVFDVQRVGEDVTLAFYGAGDGGADVELSLSTDETDAFVNALHEQASRADEAAESHVDDTWRDVVGTLTSGDSGPSSGDTSGWREYTCTLLTTDDDDPLALLREVFA